MNWANALGRRAARGEKEVEVRSLMRQRVPRRPWASSQHVMSRNDVRVGSIALGALSLCVWVAVASPAQAQEVRPTTDDAERAGAEAWFEQYIQPGLLTAALTEQGKPEDLTVPPEKPKAPAPKKMTPTPLFEVGSMGMLTLDPDVPQERGEWSDTLVPGIDSIHPAMFRFYFEPVPPPKAPPRT